MKSRRVQAGKAVAAGIRPVEIPVADVLAEVRAVYDALGRLPVARDCCGHADCCRFQLTGRTPHLTAGEALLLAWEWRAGGRRELPATTGGACPFLDAAGRCQVYAARPIGCRTHYCRAAGGPLERGAVREFIHRLEAVDARLGGRGPMPLTAAVQAALAVLRGRRPRRRRPRRAE